MATYKYGNKITRTSSGATRTWRSYIAYTITTSTDKVSYSISVGVENCSSASMAFDAKKLDTYLYEDSSQKKHTENSSKLSLNGGAKKTIISSYSGSFTRGSVASTHTLKGYSTASSSCAWHGTSTVSISVSVPAVGEPEVTADSYHSTYFGQVSLDVSIIPTTTDINVTMTFPDDIYAVQVLEYDEDGEPSVFGDVVTITDYTVEADKYRIQEQTNKATGRTTRHTMGHSAVDPITNILLYATEEVDNDYVYIRNYDNLEVTVNIDDSQFPNTDFIDYLFTTTVHYGGTSKTETTILEAEHEQVWKMDFVVSGIDSLGYPEVDKNDFIREAVVKAYPWDSDNEQFSEDPDILAGDFLLTRIGVDESVNPPQYTWSIPITLGKEYVDDPLSLTPNAKVSVEWQNVSYLVPDGDRAFYQTTKNMNYANGLANAVFVGGCNVTNYSSRVWYSQANNPLYFPDTNYMEVGSNDTSVYGLTKVGDYLCIVKQGKTTDTSIYLAYATSFEDDTTYAVKQGLSGVGADSRYSFNIMNEEALFLSNIGVMAIVPSEDDEKRIQNRSYFIDKKLATENHELAYSFVFGNMYFLAFQDTGHCYVLDGNQRNSWGNDKTNLVYECYYMENIFANNFVKFNDSLWFSNGNNLCRFRTDEDTEPYKDGYGGEDDDVVVAEWSTVFDDDGSLHYYKTMQKKGNLVSILPTDYRYVAVEITEEEWNENRKKYFELTEDGYVRCDDESIFNGGNYFVRGQSSTKVYVRKDDAEPVEIERTFNESSTIPSEMMLKKKFKKYKRLQFIIRNEEDEPFGVDEIIKSYTVGNYAKK